jgi:hypothetical protein
VKLYKISVTDPYAFTMSGTTHSIGGHAFSHPITTPVWSTIVPASHYLEAIAVAAEKHKPPFTINVEVNGDIDDRFIKGDVP